MSGSLIGTATGIATALIGRLGPAAFRGVPFYVQDAGGTYGQRYADHIYPGRDTPYAEPLGREQRTWQITGYTIGPRYRIVRDLLILACDRKTPGTFWHPAIGAVQAVCRSIRWAEQREAGGYCSFQLEFAEPGQLLQPTGLPDTAQLLERAADALGTAAQDAFTSVFNVDDALSYVSDFAATDVQAVSVTLERMRKPAAGIDQSAVTEALSGLYDDAAGLVSNPPELGTRTSGAFEAFSDAGEPYGVGLSMLTFATEYQSGADYVDVVAPISPFAAGTRTIVAPRAVDPPGTEYSSSAWLARNQGAWQRFAREQALREVGYLTPAMDFTSQSEADTVMAAMTTAFDMAETAAADAGEDDVYIALIDLRGACMADIITRRTTLAPMVQYRMPRTTNAITMAWKFYQDANRAVELVLAANVYTPAFMPIRGTVKAV